MKLVQKPKHGSREWRLLRHRDENNRVIFGASEAAALMGASSFVSRPELFAQKSNEPEVGVETDAFRRGNLLEPVLIAEASHVLGIPFTTPNWMYANGRFIATLDGVDNPPVPNVICEAKTTTRYQIRTADDLPAEWLWQAWAQQFATMCDGQYPMVVFSVLDANQKISVLEAPMNDEAIAKLQDEAERFAERIENNEPPADFDDAVIDARTVAQIWRARDESVELTEQQMNWLRDLTQAKEMAKEAETIKQLAEDQIALILKHCTVGTFGGVKVVSWKEQAGRATFDSKTFREEHPSLYKQFERAGKPFRVMRTHNVSE